MVSLATCRHHQSPLADCFVFFVDHWLGHPFYIVLQLNCFSVMMCSISSILGNAQAIVFDETFALSTETSTADQRSAQPLVVHGGCSLSI